MERSFAYTLRYGREESIEDPRCHERMECRGCGAPDCCCDGEDHEPEQDRVTAEIGGEGDDEDAAGAQHEHVADLGVVDFILGDLPDPRTRSERREGYDKNLGELTWTAVSG